MKRYVLPVGSILVGSILGLAHLAFAISGLPISVATVWVDDSGNGSSTGRTWFDINHSYIPDCAILNPAANGECGPASPCRHYRFASGLIPAQAAFLRR